MEMDNVFDASRGPDSGRHDWRQPPAHGAAPGWVHHDLDAGVRRKVMEAGEALKIEIGATRHAGLTCETVGPLARSGALLVHYVSTSSDAQILRGEDHPLHYRIAVMLEPMDAEVWTAGHSAWTGVLPAGRFRIVLPGTTNQWRRRSGCNNANVFIPKAAVAGALANAGEDPAKLLKASAFIQDREVHELAHKLMSARSRVHDYSDQYCDGLVTALVGYLLANYTDNPRSTRRSALDRDELAQLLAWIEHRRGTPPTVKEMASRHGFSESHFSREFSLATGLPPHKYVLNMRLNRAAEMLVSDDSSILDVALELGFNSASHFSSAFAQRFEISPVGYRRRQRVLEGGRQP